MSAIGFLRPSTKLGAETNRAPNLLTSSPYLTHLAHLTLMLLFTQPSILKEIGHPRLAKLLHGFEQDLKDSNLSLPDPDAQNGEYFSDLAALFARPDTLPASLRNTLLVLEHAATPENDAKVQDAIHRRIPRVLVSRTCPLDRVLDLWFLVPDELSQFNSAIEISNAEMQREHSLSPSEGERERGLGRGVHALTISHLLRFGKRRNPL